jgi:hypothetical protein
MKSKTLPHFLQINGGPAIPIIGSVVDTPNGGNAVRYYGRCHKCGCTDDDCSRCIARTGSPCSCADEDHTLCSACVESPAPRQLTLRKSRRISQPKPQPSK